MAELCPILSVSKSTVTRWVARGTFPRPVRLGPNSVAWRRADVNLWLAERQPTR